MDILDKGKITKIEDHGTILVAWLENGGVESPVYFDQSQFDALANSYSNSLNAEEFIYDGKVVWTTAGI